MLLVNPKAILIVCLFEQELTDLQIPSVTSNMKSIQPFLENGSSIASNFTVSEINQFTSIHISLHVSVLYAT